MVESIVNMFSGRIDKCKMISFINEKEEHFSEALKIAFSDEQPQAWRAAWIICHCMHKNDSRLQLHIKTIIETIMNKKDGHQRELLKMLEKMDITEEHEGYVFDICITIWESINKSPSVRITAFRILQKIAKKYPELTNEIKFLTQPQYLESLSPGIKNSFNKILNEKVR